MILTIGNINVDIICSVPHLPKPDDKVIVSNLSIVPGGGACNFAVGLARLGSDVSLFGHVGNDHNGKKGIESLILENVDTSNVVVEADIPTGFVIILVDKNGQSIKIGYREANELLSPKEITINLLNNVKIVHVSSVNAEIALKVAKLCKKLNIISSIDLGGEMMSLSSEQILRVISDYSIVFMNQLGFQRAFNVPEIAKVDLKKAMNQNVDIFNITMGENGSYILADGQIIEIPSFKVPVIDTTGAGDAYAAGFIHYYLEGLDLKDIGTRAAACAALQITISNARDGMPRKDEVEEFIRSKQTM